MAEGVGLLERHDAEAEAFREVRAPRGEKKIHLRSRKRFAQGEAERDGEERVSHPVVGADDEDAPQCFGAGKTPLHPDRAAGDAGEHPREQSGWGVEARIGHAIAASQASTTRSTSRSRRHL
ncbi:MAG: hypothetical protein E6J62_03315 [Deltaproteobacteria bacterium]|nr:MAG: hypothetical protein E6J62_03315 [Deltaproteobacteria bacterium]